MVLPRKDGKVGLSDSRENVAVTLTIEDWAVILLALSMNRTEPETQSRITQAIYESARQTTRALS